MDLDVRDDWVGHRDQTDQNQSSQEKGETASAFSSHFFLHSSTTSHRAGFTARRAPAFGSR